MSETDKNNKVTVQDYYNEKATIASDLKSKGQNLETVDLEETVEVRFIKDYGFIKKGHVQKISKVAFDIYQKNKCIEKIG